MEQAAHEALVVGADRAVEEDEQIDVGVQAQMAAAVSAERDDRDRSRGSAARRRTTLLQNRVDSIGVALDGRTAAAAGAASSAD